MRYPKHDYIRSKELMRNAREIPCQHCGADDGTVCGAHTNWGGGKGKSVKADDNLIASLCFDCHAELDQGKTLDKEQRKLIIYDNRSTQLPNYHLQKPLTLSLTVPILKLKKI